MVPYFLQRLGLDTTADERAIRRAYARELKKIDQENDPEGFQSLRSAYDAALLWDKQTSRPVATSSTRADHQDAAGVSGPETVRSFAPRNVAVPKLRRDLPQDMPAAPAQRDDPSVIAERAYAGFMETFTQAMADPLAVPNYEPWQAAIEELLESEALVSIAARDIFERKVAHLLTQGWKRGHEALFVAASNVFRWNEDRRHLQRFGNVGFVLDRALQERALFDCQQPKDRALQRTLIVRLRSSAEPTAKELQSSFAILENVVRNFPTWLGIITDVDQLSRWRELHAALPLRKQAKPISVKPATRASAKTGSSGYGWAAVLFLIFLANAARLVGSGPTLPPLAVPTTSATSKLELPLEPPPAPPGNVGTTSTSFAPPIAPRPLSQKAVAALVKRAPSPEVCDEVFRISQVHGLGTPQQDADPGPAFDRQIMACVGKRYWPQSMVSDVSVEQAFRREKARLAVENRKLQADLAKIRLNPPATYQPGAVPQVKGIFKDSAIP